MKLVIYGSATKNSDFGVLQGFFVFLKEHSISYIVFHEYAEALFKTGYFSRDLLLDTFTTVQEIQGFDFFYSIGGDGTILNSVYFATRANLPVLGVNVGRLGFLAAVSQFDLVSVTLALQQHSWRVDKRTLIEIQSSQETFGDNCCGLNEVTLHKSNTNEMIVIHAYINGEFMNSYWADGLIIATPTGSTAYSLACGGPIIFPQASIFVLTPIAPHSLTVRPMIIPDHAIISFGIESRSGQALIALDNRTVVVSDRIEVAVKKSAITLDLVKPSFQSYFSILRKRLNWGVDSRN